MIKANNFDFLRFIFALLVVVSHAHVLSGTAEPEWLYDATSGQLHASDIGLHGFFVLSGYLIYKSLQRSQSLAEYYWKRLLRLLPGLLVVLLLTVFLAPFVYENAIPYLQNPEVYSYFPNNLSLYHLQYGIDGVFENNPYPSAINGSLWTICYEFSLYTLLSVLFFFRKDKRVAGILATGAFLSLFISHNFFLAQLGNYRLLLIEGRHFINLGAFFMAGSVLAACRFEKLAFKKTAFFLAVLFLFLSIWLQFYNEVKHIVFPVLTLLFGLVPLPFLSSFGKRFGDMSYGIYIYGFPVQQTLVHFFAMDATKLLFWSVILSIAFGFFSWHLVEKNVLKYKKIPFFKRANAQI